MSDTPRTDKWKRINDPIEDLHAFARQLERELNEANERIRLLIAERDTARRQADQNWKLREEFRELLGTDDVEQGVAVVREMKERIKRLEEMYEGEIGENEQFLGSNLQGLLTRELNWSKERIKRLEEAGDAMAAWLLDPRNLGGGSSMASQWYKAKEAKP